MQLFHQSHAVQLGEAPVDNRQIKTLGVRDIECRVLIKSHSHGIVRGVQLGFCELEQVFIIVDDENFWCGHTDSPWFFLRSRSPCPGSNEAA